MTPRIDKCALMLIDGIREYVSHKKYLHRIGEEADNPATRIVAELAASPCGNHLAREWQVGEGVSLFLMHANNIAGLDSFSRAVSSPAVFRRRFPLGRQTGRAFASSDLPTMLGDRIWHPLVLWDQAAPRLRSSGKVIGYPTDTTNPLRGRLPRCGGGPIGTSETVVRCLPQSAGCIGPGNGARLMTLVLHDDLQREFAHGPAQGFPS
jgi:hypothetical protein